MNPPVRFHVRARRGPARLGTLTVRGRTTPVPAFMPVGTQGTVKGIPGRTLVDLGFRAILANTYHLHLRPGEEQVRELGGLHRFMDYPGVILTDSGGYQVFSLAERRTLDDDGVTFQSHLDGTRLRLTPERAMEIQHDLDSDIAMVLDECPPSGCGREELEGAVRRSRSWARRSLARHRELSEDRAVFAIVQGGEDAGLRAAMAGELAAQGFDGYALGGVSVGEEREAVLREIETFAGFLPEEAPRYLMGIGHPRQLVAAVQHGIDLFDCVLPTRNARNGFLFTRQGVVKIRNARHGRDPSPLEEGCPCQACRRHGRAYLRHLFLAGELLGAVLATEHNLTFFARLMADLRSWIAGGDVDLSWLEAYPAAADPASPSSRSR